MEYWGSIEWTKKHYLYHLHYWATFKKWYGKDDVKRLIKICAALYIPSPSCLMAVKSVLLILKKMRDSTLYRWKIKNRRRLKEALKNLLEGETGWEKEMKNYEFP